MRPVVPVRKIFVAPVVGGIELVTRNEAVLFLKPAYNILRHAQKPAVIELLVKICVRVIPVLVPSVVAVALIIIPHGKCKYLDPEEDTAPDIVLTVELAGSGNQK